MPETSCSALGLLPLGAGVCVFCARTSRRKRRGHTGAVLSRTRGLVGRASLNGAGRRKSHPDRLGDLRKPRASAPGRGSGASHGPRATGHGPQSCRGEGVGSVAARLTGSHWVFAVTHPSLSHLPCRPATKGSRLGPCLPRATLQRCSRIQNSRVPRLEAGPEVLVHLIEAASQPFLQGSWVLPRGLPGVFRAPTCGPGVLAVAAAIIVSRPAQWTELGQPYLSSYFYCSRIQTKFAILGLPWWFIG